MQIRVGYELVYGCTQPTPMLLTLNIHHTRAADIVVPDNMVTYPQMPLTGYRDGFGNWVTRLVAPAGQITLTSTGVVNDSGLPDEQAPWAQQIPVEMLPEETLVYLLGSRYCDTDLMMSEAWRLFGNAPMGWGRVQAIVDFVHQHVTFGYNYARPTKTASETYQERAGVCRDFAHLAVTLCRCMNIPARYCTGYLGDIGVPYNPGAHGTSRVGSRPISTASGTPSTRATTCRASDAC